MKYLMITYLAITLLMSGCSMMSKSQCENANWESLGYSDFNNGWSMDLYKKSRVKSCSKHGIKPDTKSYIRGRHIALDKYCSFDGGVANGTYSLTIDTTCIGHSGYTDFVRGFNSATYEPVLSVGPSECPNPYAPANQQPHITPLHCNIIGQ